MEGLKARSYARSELTDLHVQEMSENTAFVSVSRVRYTSDGQELERLGETYTLWRTDDGWKIAVAMIHDPDTIFRSFDARKRSPEHTSRQGHVYRSLC
jgi:hypothetical protein